MRNSEEGRLLLGLSIQRISYLRPEEKLLLWDLVDDELSLSLLLSRDVEAAIGRDLGERVWAPDSYLEAAVRDARYLESAGCRFIHFDDVDYPAALRETARPPFGLFARGRAPSSELGPVSVVGTRLPTGRGLAAAFELSKGLSAAGAMVVSGLARGIDSAAHRGAIAGARGGARGGVGGTCAVLPCGIDAIYPPGNRALASEILDSGGCLLSEYPPGEEIRKYRFPERNRIIAGLSRACVVVEAPAKSGALITSDHALDEGRDVWVSSACLGGPRSAGIDALAESGAQAAERAEDILADWDASVLVSSAEGRDAPRFEREERRSLGGVGEADGVSAREGERMASRLRDELRFESEPAKGRPGAELMGESR
jgi:DNA processing protein